MKSFRSNEDSGVVCQKVECRANDIPCILNLTKSIQWQHVSLPTMPFVSGPTDVINVQTIAYSVHPNNDFKIVAGNDADLFDVIRQPGFTDRGRRCMFLYCIVFKYLYSVPQQP